MIYNVNPMWNISVAQQITGKSITAVHKIKVTESVISFKDKCSYYKYTYNRNWFDDINKKPSCVQSVQFVPF